MLFPRAYGYAKNSLLLADRPFGALPKSMC
jgi:hypothetical protein